MKKTKVTKGNKNNHSGLIIPTLVVLVVGTVVISNMPSEVWSKTWEYVKMFSNTWVGAFVIIFFVALPTVITVTMAITKLFKCLAKKVSS